MLLSNASEAGAEAQSLKDFASDIILLIRRCRIRAACWSIIQ